jgi:hypothetical protein
MLIALIGLTPVIASQRRAAKNDHIGVVITGEFRGRAKEKHPARWATFERGVVYPDSVGR